MYNYRYLARTIYRYLASSVVQYNYAVQRLDNSIENIFKGIFC